MAGNHDRDREALQEHLELAEPVGRKLVALALGPTADTRDQEFARDYAQLQQILLG